jgi:hypothetical protein
MKNLYKLLAITALLLSTCTVYLNEGDAGTVAITIGHSARAADLEWLNGLDPKDLVHIIQVFDENGAEQHRVENLRYGSTSSFTLMPGFYTFQVTAFYEGEQKAAGREERTIHPGKNPAIIIQMGPVGPTSGKILTGIAAVYNNSTPIYASMPLDHLKQYLTVTAAYSDGSEKELDAEDYELSGELTAGTSSTITVTYEGKTDTFTVDVSPAALVSITAVYSNSTVTIYTSTPLDNLKQYLTVTAAYNNGDVEELDADEYTLSGELTAGTPTITVNYGEQSDTFTPTVTAVVLTGITAEFTPTTEIFPDTTHDTLKEGLTVTATYNDGNSKMLNAADYTLSGELTVGESVITVTYTEGGVTKTADFTVTVDALTHEHNWVKISETAPTCTAAGMETWECTAITPSHHEDRPGAAALGHDEGEWHITLEATCSATGTRELRCTRDNAVLNTEPIAINIYAHNWNNNYTVTTPATCMATGIETDTCSRNASHTRTRTVDINPAAHNWNNSYTVTTPATCSATGIATDTCSLNVSHTRTQTIPIDSTAHDFSNWTTTAPTCTTTGIDTRICSRNPAHKETRNETAINPNAHAWETIPTVAATVTDDGREGRVCNNNHDHDEITILWATGTEGLVYEPISINDGTDNAYRVHNGGNRTFTAVHIPAFHREDADSPYLPVTEISNGTDTIASNAFGGTSTSDTNTTLTTVTFAAESQLTTIGVRAFYQCTSLDGIIIPDSVQTIGQHAFGACSSLTGITIPASVTSLGDQSAFIQCTSLATVTFAEGIQLTTISMGAFSFCTSLTGITIPAGVTTIDPVAFSGCTSLASVTIGAGVESIGIQAFQNCTSLASVTIGAGVTSIGMGAFNPCDSLASVIFEGTIPSSGFDNNAGQYAVFPGDLRDKFFAAPNTTYGTPGTYTREPTATVWTLQD